MLLLLFLFYVVIIILIYVVIFILIQCCYYYFDFKMFQLAGSIRDGRDNRAQSERTFLFQTLAPPEPV